MSFILSWHCHKKKKNFYETYRLLVRLYIQVVKSRSHLFYISGNQPGTEGRTDEVPAAVLKEVT
ncbi:MAG: hypothetical protein JL50_21685 [Peptococcaceae bacterium BICA1-7]|nr:MAG: hypothetical protein JL50_21685 [Peptococcaceae bacterium BICA1-7]HBV99350.1 hypothetical protein [Desulfotomaculum sp.]